MLAFYADESGSFDLHNPTQPWVVLLAIGFDDDEWLSIDRALNDLKAAYFPGRAPQEIEIRSNDLRMAHVHPREGNPFCSLSPSELRSFGDDLYTVIDRLSFAWCASVLHKPSAIRNFSLSRQNDLFAVAYRELLNTLDRWCRLVRQSGTAVHGSTR